MVMILSDHPEYAGDVDDPDQTPQNIGSRRMRMLSLNLNLSLSLPPDLQGVRVRYWESATLADS
jgi:hypothetical protein